MIHKLAGSMCVCGNGKAVVSQAAASFLRGCQDEAVTSASLVTRSSADWAALLEGTLQDKAIRTMFT